MGSVAGLIWFELMWAPVAGERFRYACSSRPLTHMLDVRQSAGDESRSRAQHIHLPGV